MTVISRYEVIVGKINGFHTREEMTTEKGAITLRNRWREAGYTADAFKVEINLGTCDVEMTKVEG